MSGSDRFAAWRCLAAAALAFAVLPAPAASATMGDGGVGGAEPSVLSCPRPAAFWARQFVSYSTAPDRLAPQDADAIAGWIAAHARLDGSGAPTRRLRADLDAAAPANARTRAERERVAFLANLAAGALGIAAPDGGRIALDPDARVPFDGTEITLGALATDVDARFRALAAAGAAQADAGYARLADALERINAGVGIGPTCESAGGTPASGARAFDLGRAFPNPFNASTSMSYAVPVGGAYVEIGVYDVSGRAVKMLADQHMESGRYEIQWDGTTRHGAFAPAGTYFIRGTVGERRIGSRVVYVQ